MERILKIKSNLRSLYPTLLMHLLQAKQRTVFTLTCLSKFIFCYFVSAFYCILLSMFWTFMCPMSFVSVTWNPSTATTLPSSCHHVTRLQLPKSYSGTKAHVEYFLAQAAFPDSPKKLSCFLH